MSASRARRVAVAFVVSLNLILGVVPAVSAAGPPLPIPSSIAAVGDSISQAASSAGSLGTDAPQNAWSTGSSATVQSHFYRLRLLNPSITASNLSVSGAKMSNLQTQIGNVVQLKPDYLTVLMGGNDLCTSTETGMTSVTNFRLQFQAAMAALTADSPDTNIYVSSIPRVKGLWELFNGNFWARFIWSVGGVCQSLLANPTSMTATDVARRNRVDIRNQDFNQVLSQVCSVTPRCLYDGGAAYATPFLNGDVSGDYFHPSIAGQQKLASVSWGRTYSWVSAPAPNQLPVAAFTSSCTDLTCTFTNTSADPDSGDTISFSWDFGDATTVSTVANPSHTYGSANTYQVTLTVTDNRDEVDTETQAVTTTAPANQPPVASFTSSCTNLACTFTDASSDPDPGGSIVSRQWEYGDGSIPDALAAHTYAAPGSYVVTLTVIDNAGDSAETTRTVTPTAAPVITDMWLDNLVGTADAGRGSWTAHATLHVTTGSADVAGATVSATWSSGATSCFTDMTGTCTITTSVNKKTGSTTFTVVTITKTGFRYTAENESPSSVVIGRP